MMEKLFHFSPQSPLSSPPLAQSFLAVKFKSEWSSERNKIKLASQSQASFLKDKLLTNLYFSTLIAALRRVGL